jgi:hypothetical protein
MIDRSIGIAGLSLAILFGVLQYYVPQFPSWAAYSGVVVGSILLGASAALLIAHGNSKDARKPVKSALLRLHVYADQRVPEVLLAENIFRWYHLRQGIVTIAPETREQTNFLMSTLFVTFEPEVIISSLRVRSPNITLPAHEVKEFNQRYAIVAFAGALAEGTLEISVQP